MQVVSAHLLELDGAPSTTGGAAATFKPSIKHASSSGGPRPRFNSLTHPARLLIERFPNIPHVLTHVLLSKCSMPLAAAGLHRWHSMRKRVFDGPHFGPAVPPSPLQHQALVLSTWSLQGNFSPGQERWLFVCLGSRWQFGGPRVRLWTQAFTMWDYPQPPGCLEERCRCSSAVCR